MNANKYAALLECCFLAILFHGHWLCFGFRIMHERFMAG